MADISLSDSERFFIIHGVQDDFRTDGRKCEDYRDIQLETGVIANTHGSCRLRIGNTELLVCVKAEIGVPLPNQPDKGIVEFNVDCSPNATPLFVARGGDELANEIKGMITRCYRNNFAIDLQELCIIKSKQCWIIYVDILLLECGGNLYDSLSIATKAALYNTAVPRLLVTDGDEGDADISLPDNPADTWKLNLKKIPLIITVSKIGHRHIVDATSEEERCCLARAVISLSIDGTCTGVRKEGSGSLDPESFVEMVETAKKVSTVLHKSLNTLLKAEEEIPSGVQKSGFL